MASKITASDGEGGREGERGREGKRDGATLPTNALYAVYAVLGEWGTEWRQWVASKITGSESTSFSSSDFNHFFCPGFQFCCKRHAAGEPDGGCHELVLNNNLYVSIYICMYIRVAF